MGFYPDNKEPVAVPAVTNNTVGIEPNSANEVIYSPDEQLAQRKYVINTVNNATGVNHQRLDTVVADLKGFADGTPVKVTYYKEHYSETDLKGKQHNTEGALHNAHKSILKIYDFEIRMAGPLSYEHDNAQQASKLTGEAYTYPGFEPEQGDRFILEVDTGKYGLMLVNEKPTRMSIRASTYFKITFSLLEFMSEELAQQIDSEIVDSAHFDKLRFLHEPGALLTHDEYIEMNFLTKQRAKLIHYYKSKFLDQVLMYSYMRPDNVYDPYVTDFLLRSLDYNEVGALATQLYSNAPQLEYSIWRAILDENIPLEAVPVSSATDLYYIGSKSVVANSLINKKYLYFLPPPMSLADFFAAQDNNGEPAEPVDENNLPATSSCQCPNCGCQQPTETDCDSLIGDVLLHVHPHYKECPLVDGVESNGASGSIVDYLLSGDEDFCSLLKRFLLTREIDVTLLHKVLVKFWKLDPMTQFYWGPFLMLLCRKSISYIHATEKVVNGYK